MGVQEMNTQEMQKVDGGLIWLVASRVAALLGIGYAIDDFVDGFVEGFDEARYPDGK